MGRLVLVHDYLLVLRGAERTFAAMADVWPEAPIATLLYDEAGMQGRFAGREMRTSPLQRLGVDQRRFRALLPVFPVAVRRLDVSDADLIVSSSTAYAHGVRKPPGARHICYCHTPFRYAWHERAVAEAEVPRPLRPALRLALRRHRSFDLRAARDVDRFVASSELGRERIWRFWGREAEIVHPPVEVDRFAPADAGDHVLFVGELVRHKRAHVAIEAAVGAGRAIKVIGEGPELPQLRARYAEQAEFLGRVDDRTLARELASAAALVVPNVEEFGIAAVEAQAAGRPVVALDAGGTRETVVRGRTGLLVSPDDPDGLRRALRSDLHAFDPWEIRSWAQRFSREAFKARIREVVEAG
jgi:glycosyltransferase involved in cell wall biosynthesis